MEIHRQYVGFAHERISKRIQLEKSRNDLIEGLLMKQDDLVSFLNEAAESFPCSAPTDPPGELTLPLSSNYLHKTSSPMPGS